MCGVFGYIGPEEALKKVVEGLQKLEYRGYDSWGLAFPLNNALETYKSTDPLTSANTDQFDLQAPYALGHTRWATHGAVNLENCHPHISTCGRFALVHNGIVENDLALRAKLTAKDTKFNSETDTEVILRLLELTLADQDEDQIDDVITALRIVFGKIQGRNTLVLIAKDQNMLIGIRNGSPLVVGRQLAGNNTHCDIPIDKNTTEFYIASDCNAFSQYTQECLVLEDQQMIILRGNDITLQNAQNGETLTYQWQTLPPTTTSACTSTTSKDSFEHYMLKEICEQWQTIPRAAQMDPKNLRTLATQIRDNNGRLYITGAGAAFFIGEQIAYLLRNYTHTSVIAFPAYDAESYLVQMQKNDILLAISQSGETADTLRTVQAAQAKGVTIASVVNMPGALLSRLSTYDFYSGSGPEMCVLSTKSGTAQLTFGYLLAMQLRALLGNTSSTHTTLTPSNELDGRAHIDALIPELSQFFKQDNLQDYIDLAQSIQHNNIYILGQGKFLAAAKIGALNIKEASYIHAEAFSAGELKHGVIALIETGTPVICFMDEENEHYMTAVAAQLKSRGARVIGIGHRANPMFEETLFLPCSNAKANVITHLIPCQILSYYLAVQRGLNPDRPRNLAKSVTVV